MAISNRRLLSLRNGQVTFRWKDYRHGQRQRNMTLPAAEFIRRFLLHVLPPSFVRIRYFGFLANRCRAEKLQRYRWLLGERPTPEADKPTEPTATVAEPGEETGTACCPVCRQGRMRIIGRLEPQRAAAYAKVPCPVISPFDDTS